MLESVRLHSRWLLRVAGATVACAALIPIVISTTPKAPHNASVLFLVATPALSDPIFERSVILMVPSTEQPLVAGLIINKPTNIPVRDLFPHATALKSPAETAYFGGPVEVAEPWMLLDSAAAPARTEHVLGDIYLSTNHDFIAGFLSPARTGKHLRVFLGRAQWSRPQLHGERMRGSWYVVQGNASLVFSSDPNRIWQDLEQRGQMVQVNLRDDGGPPPSMFLPCAMRLSAAAP